MKKFLFVSGVTVILSNLCSCVDNIAYESAVDVFMEEQNESYEATTSEFDIDDISDIISELSLPESEKSTPDIPETNLTVETASVTVNSTSTSVANESETTAVESDSENTGKSVCIDVPYISQKGEYPTGCELVSASMLLKFYGFEISAGELIEKGYVKHTELEYDDKEDRIYCADPNESFIGNPRDESGYGCYSNALRNGLEKYLENEYFDAVNLSGISLEDLCMEYIDFGEPVLIWASINMVQTKENEKVWIIKETGEEFRWLANEHCLVLVGYDDEYYYFNDPLKDAAVPYEKEVVELRYKELGLQAMTIRPW